MEMLRRVGVDTSARTRSVDRQDETLELQATPAMLPLGGEGGDELPWNATTVESWCGERLSGDLRSELAWPAQTAKA